MLYNYPVSQYPSIPKKGGYRFPYSWEGACSRTETSEDMPLYTKL